MGYGGEFPEVTGGGAEDEEDEVEEMVQAEFIAMLDADEDPHLRCKRAIRLSAGEEAEGAPAVLQDLYSHGLYLRQEPADVAAAVVVVAAAGAAAAAGCMQPGGEEGHDADVRGDNMVMLDRDSAVDVGLEPAIIIFEELRKELERHIKFAGGSAHCEYQLATYIPAQKGYARHRDSLPNSGAAEPPMEEGGVGPQRIITAILYGCEAGTDGPWRSAVNGGSLRTWPSTEALKGIASKSWNGTSAELLDSGELRMQPAGLVCFLSGALDHEVEPVAEAAAAAGAVRSAFTCWYS